MLALHIALYVLLGSALLFAIIELGLTGFIVSQYGGSRRELSCDSYTDCSYVTVKNSVPGIFGFVIFTAVWTMLVTVAAAVLPWFYSRKGGVTTKFNMILGIVTIVVYFVTCVFWLASFADIVSEYNSGFGYGDYLNAVIAFAVLLWLIFVALVVLTILTAVGVLLSSWPGYQSMRKERAPQGTGPPAHDVPMSTTPVAAPVDAPSELSTRDAEALHDQAPSQSHSTSSPSAVTSAELDGGSHGHR